MLVGAIVKYALKLSYKLFKKIIILANLHFNYK